MEAVLEGQLFVAGVPADTGTVVLHRVNPEESGPVDSVRVSPDGRFRLLLPNLPIPGSGEVYFASARHEGILYFGPPISAPVQLDESYAIRMFPTQPAPPEGIAFPVHVRNLFLEEGPFGWRVVDLFAVENLDEVTWVTAGEDTPVWRYPLPPGARNFQLGEGDLAPGAARFEGGSFSMHAPFPPGERVFVFRYELDAPDFTLPLPGVTETLELLVRQPAPTLRIPGLTASPPEEIERGSVYNRWWGANLEDRVLRIEEGTESERDEGALLLLGLALVLAVVGVWAVRRVQGGGHPGSGGEVMGARVARERTLVEIARLDEEREKGEIGEEEWAERRATLLARLEGASDPAPPADR